MASKRTRDAAKKGLVPPPPKRTGRQTLLTPALLANIVEAKRLGMSDARTAAFVGIDGTTLSDWKARGAEDRAAGTPGVFADLSTAYEKATADRVAESLLRIREAGVGGAVTESTTTTTTHADGTTTTTVKEKKALPAWQADAWFLERTYADEYGRFVRTEVSGKDGGPIAVASWKELMELADKAPVEPGPNK